MSSKRPRGDLGNGVGRKRLMKRQERVELNPLLWEAKERVSEAWSLGLEYCHEQGLAVDTLPFPHCVIPNFIQSQPFLDGLHNELLQQRFQEKSNDLYKFQQSGDLKESKEHHIVGLRNVLFEDFRRWLTDITEVKLENTVDLSCAMYEYTDVLLCHDDELEGRRFAFILYLVPEWETCDGGTLDLYDVDEHYQPRQIVKSLTPSWNTLVFFEVSPVSYHQVSEVVSEGKCRLSVSGWFHGPSLERPPRYIESLSPRHQHIACDEQILYDWISPIYMDMQTQAQVQEEFEEKSAMLLKNFLKKEKFQMVCEALHSTDMKWKRKGPANKRCYHQADEDGLPDILAQCMKLFRSEAMFLLLSNFTGLKLHLLAASNEDEEEEEETGETSSEAKSSAINGHECSSTEIDGKPEAMDQREDEIGDGESGTKENEESGEKKKPSVPMCRGELRHWRNGYYTLIHDTNVENSEFALDLLLFCRCKGWDAEFGGVTSYIAKGEDEELLTLSPEENSLALIYRDKETLKFVKHINQRSVSQCLSASEKNGFWDFSFVYYE
uniref:Prolyl 3-hydroxylase OGFOD1 n=1 Tax=Callorhinchus milii TaxID=7868 RepID=V9KLK0_CALMI